MRKWFSVVGTILVILWAGCQEKKTFLVPAEVGRGRSRADSLRALWSWLEGQRSYEAETLRLWTLYKLIVSSQNPDSAYKLAQRLEGLARQGTYPGAEALSCLGWVSLYLDKYMYDSALFQAHRALAVLGETGDEQLRAQAFHLLGLCHQNKANNDSALTYYELATRIREAIGDKAGLASSYNLIGIIYSDQGRHAEALYYYHKARQIQEAIGDTAKLAYSYGNIGNIYSAQGRYAEALDYYQRARQILEAAGNEPLVSYTYINIGTIYSSQRRYAEALDYYQKARQTLEVIGDERGLVSSYNGIGSVYSAQGQYAEALKYYQEATRIGEAAGDPHSLILCYANMGDLYRLLGQPNRGRTYLLRALSLADQLRANESLQDIYRMLSLTDSLLAASGQPAYWKSAYEYARLHQAYSDSVVNEESIRKQAQLESQYEYDKKTALLKAEQEKERALAAAELRRRATQRNLSLAALGIALAGMGVFGVLYRTIRRQKKLLQVQAEEIQEKNASLEQYNAELQSTNQALEASYRVIQEQAEALRERNAEILDSIRYAERIQRAILPSEEKWRRLLRDSFLVYLPRDIIAGDFYWLQETERYVFLGIADATGHGVPGAFVSLVCANALNKAVIEERLESPAEILTRAKDVVSGLLTQEGGKLRDGMDIALIRFDREARWRLTYAGANRPLWIVTADGEVLELKPTRQPIGYTEEEKPFEEVALDLHSRLPVMVYGFTDGILDQMGGPKGRKLFPKGLREFLLQIYREPVWVQGDKVRQFFMEWRGELNQMDDVTLVGVRVE